MELISRRSQSVFVLLSVGLIVYSLIAIFSGTIFGTEFQSCPNPLFPCQSNLTIDPQFLNHALPLIMLMAIAVIILVFALTAETRKGTKATGAERL